MLIEKIKNYAEHLEDLKIKREAKKEYLDEKIKEMEEYIYQIKKVEGDVNEKGGTLMEQLFLVFKSIKSRLLIINLGYKFNI